MDWLKPLLSFLADFIPHIFMYNAGKKSKELDDIKEENETLKEFKKIDEKEITKKEVYTSDEWV